MKWKDTYLVETLEHIFAFFDFCLYYLYLVHFELVSIYFVTLKTYSEKSAKKVWKKFLKIENGIFTKAYIIWQKCI